MKSFFSLLGVCSMLLFMGVGCTFRFGPVSDGGVYRSLDSGVTWAQKTLVDEGKNKGSFSGSDTTVIRFDPRDGKSIFLGTKQDGLFYTADGGESWKKVLPGLMIQDIGIDTDSRCVVYALTQKQLQKTSDCAQHWTVVYNETRSSTMLTSLAIDTMEPSRIYLGTSSGDVFTSEDRGAKWSTAYRLKDKPVSKLIVDRWDPSVLYLASRGLGLFKGINKAQEWTDITGTLKDEEKGLGVLDIQSTVTRGGLLYLADGGIFRSSNAGTTWERVPLLTPPGTARILAMGTAPSNDNSLYYVTPNTIYRTQDGGITWIPTPLPTKRSGSFVAVDPYNESTVYLGIQLYTAPSPFF